MIFVITLLILLPLISLCHARALVALDRVISDDLVSTRNATVIYQIHNVGNSDATQISFKDLSFPASRFHLHSGAFRYTQDKLAAGDSLSLTAVVTPKRSGYLYVTPASVSYVDEAGESHVTRFAADETVSVEDILEYRRRTDRHRQEWAAYGVVFTLLGVGPMVMSLVMERGVVDGGKKKTQ